MQNLNWSSWKLEHNSSTDKFCRCHFSCKMNNMMIKVIAKTAFVDALAVKSPSPKSHAAPPNQIVGL